MWKHGLVHDTDQLEETVLAQASSQQTAHGHGLSKHRRPTVRLEVPTQSIETIIFLNEHERRFMQSGHPSRPTSSISMWDAVNRLLVFITVAIVAITIYCDRPHCHFHHQHQISSSYRRCKGEPTVVIVARSWKYS